MGSNPSNTIGMQKSILSGFFYNCARLAKSGSYTTVKHPHSVDLHPSSSLIEARPKMVCYYELVKTEKEFMRTVIEVKGEWLLEVAPHYYSSKELKLDEERKPKNVGAAAEKGLK